MPYVNIKITKEEATAEQKAALIRGVTELLVNVQTALFPASCPLLLRCLGSS